MPKIIIKINNKKVGTFQAKIAKIEGNRGVLRDGRPVRKDKRGQWIYEPK